MELRLVNSQNYQDTMDNVVLPYIRERLQEGYYERLSGRRLHYERITACTISEIKADPQKSRAPRGAVILVHGFTEGIHKFYETAYYYLKLGYNVWLFQQLGHGQSTRLVEDPGLVDIRDYRDLVEDLHGFVSTIVKAAEAPGSSILVHAHSMGGGMTACLLEMYPDDFRNAILSSPMLALTVKGPLLLASIAYVKFLIAAGHGQDRMPGAEPYKDSPDFENSCTNCLPRYDYHWREIHSREDYHSAACTNETALEFERLTSFATDFRNLKKITANVLLIKASKDNMVGENGQDRFLKGIGTLGKSVRLDGKHELYRENDDILKQYWSEIVKFLGIDAVII